METNRSTIFSNIQHQAETNVTFSNTWKISTGPFVGNETSTFCAKNSNVIFCRAVGGGGVKNGRGKHRISAAVVVHRCEGSFLASKHRGWPWTIYVHRTSTTRLKALPIGLRRNFHKLRPSIIQYTAACENIQRRSRTQSMWLVVVSWNDFTTNYCAIAMQSHGTDDIKERVHRINIELPHAICSYSVNEREFIACLRTRRNSFSYTWRKIFHRATTYNFCSIRWISNVFYQEKILRYYEIIESYSY